MPPEYWAPALSSSMSLPPLFGEVIDQVVQEAGSLDILVNSAGILRDGVPWK